MQTGRGTWGSIPLTEVLVQNPAVFAGNDAFALNEFPFAGVQCWKLSASLLDMQPVGGLVEDQSGELDPDFHQSFCSTLKKGLRAKLTGGSGPLQPHGNRSLNG